MFGYLAAEALGRSLDLVIPEQFRARHLAGYHQVIPAGTSQCGQRLLAVPAVKKDGTRISIEFNVHLIRDSEEAVYGAAAIIRDVIARWEEPKHLRTQDARLEGQVNSRKG